MYKKNKKTKKPKQTTKIINAPSLHHFILNVSMFFFIELGWFSTESPLREGNKMLTLIKADKFLNPDDRKQSLLSGNSNIIEIAVEELEIG